MGLRAEVRAMGAASGGGLGLVEAGGAHVGEAALLVGALVVADLAEQVGQAPVLAVLRRIAAGVWRSA
jgi:hypothetical protein